MIKEYRKKDGSKAYMFVAYLGVDPITGKQRRTTRRGFKTQREAKLAEAKLQAEIEASGFTRQTELTFKDVYELWLVHHRNIVKPGTFATTKRYAELHILPLISDTKIKRITMTVCQKLVNHWATHFASAKYPKGITQQVFDHAVKMNLISDNPMRKVALPKKHDAPEKKKFYNSAELKHFFECAEDYGNLKFTTFFRLLAFTGARKGEILALQWQDIDFDKMTLHVRKTVAINESSQAIIQSPKTKKSIREIGIDEGTIALLKRWRAEQQQTYLMSGINTLRPEQFLFTKYDNHIYQPPIVNGWYETIISKYNLDNITLHGFRHTHCSLLFEMGTPIQVVQERLGHSNIKTTMDIYTHVTEKARDAVADDFARHVNF